MPQKDNPQYIADMTFGFGEEDKIQPFLEDNFGKLKKLCKYHPFDFENDEYIIEVKSRRIPHNKYKTLMFNYSKLEKLELMDTEKTAVFVFNCDDGVYCWEYDSTEFFVGRGGRCDRGCNEYSQMAYVDINKLYPLVEMPTFNVEEKESCCETLRRSIKKNITSTDKV
jgi:hypothetical protein